MQPDTPDHNPTRHWLTQIWQSQQAGHTCLPACLGLSASQHQHFIAHYLPECSLHTRPMTDQEAIREDLLQLRHDEWQQLYQLLHEHRLGQDPEAETAWASIIAAACLGSDHLWHDLGLTSRQELRDLLFYYFPTLAARNVKNMRWKRFFYKQLCEQEGGYVCRAPTCEQCSTYQECFGDE